MIELSELYKLQAELDEEIAVNHGVTYETTFSRRLLSLLVELGELANETRCFKYWSSKGPSPKERIVDEYADGLHFLLSLGIPLKTHKMTYSLTLSSHDLTNQFHHLYQACSSLFNDYSLQNYERCMALYLNLALSLDMDEEDIKKAYLNKLSVNHTRQKTNY